MIENSIDHGNYRNHNKSIEIIFDSAKDKANQTKHGVSLGLAAELDWPEVKSYVEQT